MTKLKSRAVREQKLAPLNLRTTPERRRRLEDAAAASGRSLAQEAERLIDLAMEVEEQLGGPDLFEAISLIGRTAALVLKQSGENLSEPGARARVTAAIHAATDWAVPLCALRIEDDPAALALVEIYTAMSMFGSNLDLRALWLLGEGAPLGEEMYGAYRNALTNLAEKLPAYTDWDRLVTRLDDLQATAVNAMLLAENEIHTTTASAEDAFQQALLRYKTVGMQFAWSQNGRAKMKVKPKPRGGPRASRRPR
jgi:hypothetical protein